MLKEPDSSIIDPINLLYFALLIYGLAVACRIAVGVTYMCEMAP